MAQQFQDENLSDTGISPIILAVESASDASSAAIYLPSGEIIQNLVEARHGHAERLTTQIDDVMRQANCRFSHITHIAAGCGPGSFTGIRVCLAAAKGLLLAGTAKPVGISLLEAMLHARTDTYFGMYSGTKSDKEADIKPGTESGTKSGTKSGTGWLSVLDSRRNSVYMLKSDMTQIQDVDEAGLHSILLSEPDLQLTGLLPDGWDAGLPQPSRFHRQLPSAVLIANLAAKQIFGGMPLAPLEPAYLAPPKLGPAKKPA